MVDKMKVVAPGAGRWLWVSLAVLLGDQLSKYAASHWLILHEAHAVLPSVNFTLVYNAGAAFSFLSDESGWQRWFFTAIALLVSLLIFFWLRRLSVTEAKMALGLALILGGALGNVWYRIQLGYVVDFIDVYYQGWHWPAFNLADSAITVGAVLLVLDALGKKTHADHHAQ